MKYSAAMACLQQLAVVCGYMEAKPSIRIPRTGLPACASQLGWNKEARNSLGRWPPNSEIANWYERAVCNNELPVRNGIFAMCREEWGHLGASTLPKRRPNTQQNEDDSSPDDSTSVLDSSECDIDISDIDDTGCKLPGCAASA